MTSNDRIVDAVASPDRRKSTAAMLSGRVSVSVSAASLAATGRGALLSAEHDGLQLALIGLPSFQGALAAAIAVQGIAVAIVEAYRREPLHVLDDIHGTFALALVDRARGEALLAVDRLGIETICYAVSEGTLVFAADAHAVATASGSVALDPQAIFDYLYSHCIPGPTTIYRGVRRLLPGHVLRFARGGATIAPYWQPAYDEHATAPLDTLEAGFLSIVEASVARSIDGAAMPACFLSGGTDSSTVAGMLRKVTGAAPRTYSIGFDAEGFDEMHYARIAAKRFGADHHEYYITPADLVASIPAIAAAYDQPFGNSSVLPTYYCAKMAESDGADRILGGDGGDELFGGNTRYAKQRVFDYFTRSPSIVQGTLRTALAPKAWESVPIVGKAQSYVRQASVPMPDRMQTYNLLTRIGIDAIFEPDFVAQVDVDAPIAAMRAWYGRSGAQTLLNRMLAFDLKYTLTDNDLPKVTTACRLAGIDVAFPLLDDALVAFAAKLAPDLKLKGMQLRWFFKHALRDFLPPEILTKSKHGFGLPFGIWLGRDQALNALAFASLESLKQRGIVRAAFIDQLRADLLADHATYYGELVWVLMMLEQWLQTHTP
jgi:asparagine synthase (glutamine-hydrolysing)